MSVLSVSAISETRNGEKNSDQSSPDISDDLFVSIFIFRKQGDKSKLILFIKLFSSCSSSVFMQFPQSLSFLEPKLSIYLVIITTKFPPPAE